MLHARRALFVLISVVALVAGFAPAAFARPGMAAASPSAATATAARASAGVNTAPAAAASQSLGYWLIASDGGVFSGGDAAFHGSTGAIHLTRPIVGIGATSSGNGYWAVASDGGIFAFGDAAFHGSTGAIHLNKPIVGIAPTPSGHGYWLVASDGGIFAFGDAAFHGSTGAMHLNQPIVGIASTPSGHGYWLVASDGGIFAFGDAAFHGSTGAMHLNQPIVGIGSSPSGDGYRMVASDGGVFSFGDAVFYGSTGAMHLNQPIVGMASTASGHGYWFVAKDGGVFSFGDAGFFGSAGALSLTSPIVGMVATAPVPNPTKLAFSTQPGDSTGGSNLATQPVVTVEDASGAPAAHDSSAVKLALTTPGGATLACDSNTQAAVAGVATFSGCAIDLAGTYTLTATDGTLTAAVSETLTVAVGPAAHLHFATEPTGAVHGVALTAQPVVRVEDAGGNLVTAGATSVVTLALTLPLTGTPALTCTTGQTRTTASGLASFTGCAIDTIGDYTLTATDPGLTATVSTQVEITNIASQLAFTTEPSVAATGGAVFAVQPVVTVQDSTGHTIVADTRSITLTITAGATVPCTVNPKAAVAGVDAFAGCRIDASGSYTLTATSGFTVVSTGVTITVGAAAKLAFTTQPGDSTGGIAFTQPVVTVQDLGGNTVTAGTASAVHLAITGSPVGAALTCTPSTNNMTTAAGVATFVGCAINLQGSYTLTATDGTLTSAASVAHPVITVGAAAKLGFTTQPGDSTGGVAFSQPVVAVQDLGGNTVTGVAATAVHLALTTPGNATMTCTPGTNSINTVNGVATFVGCAIDRPGSYTLTATASGLTTTVSGAHPVIAVGAVTHLVFATAPVGSTGGVNFGTEPVVTQDDAGGNVVTTANTITLTLTAAAGATLTCTSGLAVATVAGVATFAGCKIDLASSRTLTATATTGGFTVASVAVVTAVGAAAKLGFTTQPGDSTGGVAFTQPVVAVQDLGGNTVTGVAATLVHLAITTPAGAVMTCTPGTNDQTTATGVATFVGCAITLEGSYTLTATATGLTTTASVAHPVITVGPAVAVKFVLAPVGSTAGVNFPTQPHVAIVDAGGNTVTTDTTSIRLVLTGTGGGVLTCTTNPLGATGGVSVFAGCKISATGSYTVTADDPTEPGLGSIGSPVTIS
jgi:hypothetical protein